jgi:hypothetical protein
MSGYAGMLACSLALSVASAGCDKLFSLDEVPPDTLAASDAAGDAVDASSMHDEDLDGVSDGDDLCPGISSVQQTDEDSDGVGDVCDPHLGSGTDTIIAREFFTGGPSAWQLENAALWQQTPDSLATTGIVALARINGALVASNPTIEVGAQIVQLGACTAGAPCKIETRLDYTGDLANCGSKGTVDALDVLEVANKLGNQGAAVPGLGAGATVTLRFTRDSGGTVTVPKDACSISSAGTSIAGVPRTSPALNAQVTVAAASMELRYIIVYDHP